jgi:L-fucose mutarotase
MTPAKPQRSPKEQDQIIPNNPKSLFASAAKFPNNHPMLKGIHPAISPELLKILAEMGHGDEIILADAHFPAHSMNPRVIRADGLSVGTLLDGILPLFELDSYADPLVMMQAVAGDQLDPTVESTYMGVINRHVPNAKPPTRIDRFAFYDRAKAAFAVIMTGETAKYGNLLLKKGVTAVS